MEFAFSCLLYTFKTKSLGFSNLCGVATNSSTLIDPTLVTESCDVIDSGVIPIDSNISDHRATYVTLKMNYKNADYVI